jgi:hypothetical protein
MLAAPLVSKRTRKTPQKANRRETKAATSRHGGDTYYVILIAKTNFQILNRRSQREQRYLKITFDNRSKPLKR